MSDELSLKEIEANYLSVENSIDRSKSLAKFESANKKFPRTIVRDLIHLPIPESEKAQLLSLIDCQNHPANEDLLTKAWLEWNQDLIISALQCWTTSSKGLLWHRLVYYSKLPELPQRVRYALVYNAFVTGGVHIISSSAELDNLSELSPAFHGLLLRRAAEWHYSSTPLLKLAGDIIASVERPGSPLERAVPDALIYLSVIAPERLKDLRSNFNRLNHWSDFATLLSKSVDNKEKVTAKFEKFLDSPPKKLSLERLSDAWPSIWHRNNLTSEALGKAFRLFTEKVSDRMEGWSLPIQGMNLGLHFFGGTSPKVVNDGLNQLEGLKEYTDSLQLTHGLIGNPYSDHILDSLSKRIETFQGDMAKILSKIPEELRFQLSEKQTAQPSDDYSNICDERQQALSPDATANWHDFENDSTDSDSTAIERHRFFEISKKRLVGLPPLGKNFWGQLSSMWIKPNTADLDKLSEIARKQPSIYQLAYIESMGMQDKNDKACLKLLDFVRSNDPVFLRATLQSFCKIGTPRAFQELVSSLTRPNINFSLRVEICHWLKGADLSGIQDEIRSALSDISYENTVLAPPEKFELTEALSDLLVAKLDTDEKPEQNGKVELPNRSGLDNSLGAKIPNFSTLSSEVKRALRTAQFFHDQVSSSGAEQAIDLSPVIDMQYKALELTFRERFERVCGVIINDGIIQRKLDLIGYARPIPAKMDEFENYVSNLPIINTVPYFSKFKMRKMLRALCQYRRGRRFTLDGLKAFGIFFLCFSRKNCRYGLENLFPLPFANDDDLANFVKTLHIFQDYRNRAAHEGFQPGAKNDIEGIWRMTGEITTEVKKIHDFVEAASKYLHDHQQAS